MLSVMTMLRFHFVLFLNFFLLRHNYFPFLSLIFETILSILAAFVGLVDPEDPLKDLCAAIALFLMAFLSFFVSCFIFISLVKNFYRP
jgi:hypothetical protein